MHNPYEIKQENSEYSGQANEMRNNMSMHNFGNVLLPFSYTMEGNRYSNLATNESAQSEQDTSNAEKSREREKQRRQRLNSKFSDLKDRLKITEHPFNAKMTKEEILEGAVKYIDYLEHENDKLKKIIEEMIHNQNVFQNSAINNNNNGIENNNNYPNQQIFPPNQFIPDPNNSLFENNSFDSEGFESAAFYPPLPQKTATMPEFSTLDKTTERHLDQPQNLRSFLPSASFPQERQQPKVTSTISNSSSNLQNKASPFNLSNSQSFPAPSMQGQSNIIGNNPQLSSNSFPPSSLLQQNGSSGNLSFSASNPNLSIANINSVSQGSNLLPSLGSGNLSTSSSALSMAPKPSGPLSAQQLFSLLTQTTPAIQPILTSASQVTSLERPKRKKNPKKKIKDKDQKDSNKEEDEYES